MSEYTTRRILDMIEANGGPEGLDLSDKGLSEIDLSRQAVQAELHRMTAGDQRDEPPWWSQDLQGVRLVEIKLISTNLSGADLEGADLEGAALLGTNLQEANLSGAKLEEAMLYQTHLEGANLSGANLRGVGPWPARFRRFELMCSTPLLLLPKP